MTFNDDRCCKFHLHDYFPPRAQYVEAPLSPATHISLIRMDMECLLKSKAEFN